MLLAADVGNTNVVFALFTYAPDGAYTIRARWRIATDPRRTGDEYAVWLLQLLKIEGVERDQITQIIEQEAKYPEWRQQSLDIQKKLTERMDGMQKFPALQRRISF